MPEERFTFSLRVTLDRPLPSADPVDVGRAFAGDILAYLIEEDAGYGAARVSAITPRED